MRIVPPPPAADLVLGFDRRRPSLLHVAGEQWWWFGGVAVAADHQRTWVLGPGLGARCVVAPDVLQVGVARGGLVLAGETAVTHVDLVDGRVSAMEVGPERAVPGGAARVWVDEGFVYREVAGRVAAVEVLGADETLAVGPDGALAFFAEGALVKLGAPGRSAVTLDKPLPARVESVRWERAGGAAAVPGGVADARTGVVEVRDGIPAAIGAWQHGDRIVSASGEVLWRGCLEATPAVQGDVLAGPGGWVWSLSAGRPLTRRRVVALGVTVAVPDGFVTVDWEVHAGWTVTRDGARRDPFVLPMDPDDTVVGGVAVDGAVEVETALGERWRIRGATVEPGDPAVDLPTEPPRWASTPIGTLEVAGETSVAGVRFLWDRAGTLLAFPNG